MPGKQIKNWRKYEALRKKGMSKKRAAMITNSQESQPTMERSMVGMMDEKEMPMNNNSRDRAVMRKRRKLMQKGMSKHGK